LFALAALSLSTLTGCGKDSDPPTGPGGGTDTTTTMTGIMINATENGRLSVNIPTMTLAPRLHAMAARRAAVTASGTFRPIGGVVVALSGTYDQTTDSLFLAGGGYAVAALVETDGEPVSMVGQYDGPNGPGFFGAISTATTSVPVFCGSYQSNTTAENGNLSYLLIENQFAGVAFSGLSSAVRPFEGTVSGTGSTRTVMGTGGQDNVDSLAISGTVNTITGMSSGIWTVTDLGGVPVDDGTWSASECP
jgi:hypothetical protein